MLEREYQYYLDSRNELLNKYDGKHLVIVGNSVAGAYESREQALDLAYAQYKPGTFLVHKCIPAEEEKREWAFLTRLRMRRRMAKMKGAA